MEETSQPTCSDERGFRVMFVCKEAECSWRVRQPLYCMMCCDQHDHKQVLIKGEIERHQGMWPRLVNEAQAALVKANPMFESRLNILK